MMDASWRTSCILQSYNEYVVVMYACMYVGAMYVVIVVYCVTSVLSHHHSYLQLINHACALKVTN